MKKTTNNRVNEFEAEIVSYYAKQKHKALIRKKKRSMKIMASNITSPFDAAVNSELTEIMRLALAWLTPREEKVMRMRFGIGEKREYNFEEISWRFCVTRERIRQIYVKAAKKLSVDCLRDYVK